LVDRQQLLKWLSIFGQFSNPMRNLPVIDYAEAKTIIDLIVEKLPRRKSP
jgi:hypothetical protein